jgi:hypothetical protein
MGSVSLALDLIDGRSSSQRTWLRTISEPVTLIGAARQCDVWLPEGGLSKVHASLVLTENAAWVVDLLGRNGVSVADRAVYWKQLYNGAILQIGRCRFRVRLYASPDPKAICRMNRVGPEILKEPDPTPASGRTVSVESVMSLIQRLNVVQRQFSECCQLQLQTITQILAHQGRGQQTPVHGEPRMPAFGTFPNRGCNASPSRK